MEKFKKIITSKTLELLVFCIIIIIVNFLKYNFDNATLFILINFINQNFWYIISLWLISFVTEIAFSQLYPFNLLGPLLEAIGSIMIIKFVLNIFKMIDLLNFIPISIHDMFNPWTSKFYSIIFIAIILFGYIKIFAKEIKNKKLKKKQVNNKKLNDEKDKLSKQ